MRKVSSFVLKTLFFSTVFLSLFLGYFYLRITALEKKYQNKIYPNVYANGISFAGKSLQDAQAFFEKKNEKLAKTRLFIVYNDTEIATFSGKLLNLKYDGKTTAKQLFSIGRTTRFLSRMYQKISMLFNLGRYDFSPDLSYQQKPIAEYLTYLEDKYNQSAQNALFKVEKGKVTAFKGHKDGLQIKKREAYQDADRTLKSLKTTYKQELTIVVEDEKINPDITLASLNDYGIVEKIGEGKSDFTGSSQERIHNIILASSKFHGVLLPKGEAFSFNQTVGDISSRTGYKPSYIIKGGKTVLGDGGGVCQVSTTLFRAALNTGLPIEERVAHAYRVHYYENDRQPGFDATVFAPYVDLKFKNDTPSHILIQTEIDKKNNRLTFSLWGKKDGRKISISESKVWAVLTPPEPLYQEDPTLKKGVVKQIDWAAWGAKAVFHYKVVKDDQIIQERDFFSSYRPWQAVYLVGTAD